MSNILFLTLKIFSATGGIEKVCRIFGKALYEYGVEHNKSIHIISMHDGKEAADDNLYFPGEVFKGYAVNKLAFILDAIKKGCASKVVILSHINLIVVGWMIKKMAPRTKVILLAHGIEIWDNLSSRKRKMLVSCDLILSVSSFTRNKIISTHGVPEERCSVLNNCLDPFLPLPNPELGTDKLRNKYGITEKNKILFTLTRISGKERYKGYDKVLAALVVLKKTLPDLRYIIAGSYDATEKAQLDQQVEHLGLASHVIIPGFIPEEEIAGHFKMADVYVMPSKKEGFGIVFIEAMYYGLPVIAGNVDGSPDALLNGILGVLVDPDNVGEIKEALEKVLLNSELFTPNRKILEAHFAYEHYKQKLDSTLQTIMPEPVAHYAT